MSKWVILVALELNVNVDNNKELPEAFVVPNTHSLKYANWPAKSKISRFCFFLKNYLFFSNFFSFPFNSVAQIFPKFPKLFFWNGWQISKHFWSGLVWYEKIDLSVWDDLGKWRALDDLKRSEIANDTYFFLFT